MQEARSWRMVQPGTLSVRGGAMPECVGSQCVARALLLVFRSVDMRTRSEALAQFSYQPRCGIRGYTTLLVATRRMIGLAAPHFWLQLAGKSAIARAFA